MNNEKLSREQVPQKFAEWLLKMGCPSEKVPSVDKISGMCRGQSYMMWRSLMERVEPKDVVRQKRLQVFCDDVQKWRKKSPSNERDTMPEPLALWQQQTELREQVADMEARVCNGHDKLKQITDKISMKLSERNTARDRIEALQRRAMLMQNVAAELRAKRESMGEIRTVADSLCCFGEDGDVQNKLDKYMSAGPSPPASDTSAISCSNRDPDAEEQLSSLVSCCGDVLWPLLCERRAAVVSALADTRSTNTNDTGPTPQSILAHTAALHSTLTLEAMKNKLLITQTKKRLADAVEDLINDVSDEAGSLLVLRCERVATAARVNTLRALLDDVSNGRGAFELGVDCGGEGEGVNFAQVDRSIESKRDDILRVLTNLAVTEKRILNIRECLIHIFNSFQKDLPAQQIERFRGLVDFPQDSMVAVRQFYCERRARRNKVELSFDLDESKECSFTDIADLTNPTFIDELKIYLKKFCLEKNRKLVLKNGETVWIFETLQAQHSRLLAAWQLADRAPVVCPSVCLSANITRLVLLAELKRTKEALLEKIEDEKTNSFHIDLESKTAEDDQIIDKIKKRLHSNLLSLQKIIKTLDLGKENLIFWSENQMKEYISRNRKHDGKTYKDYEAFYIETSYF